MIEKADYVCVHENEKREHVVILALSCLSHYRVRSGRRVLLVRTLRVYNSVVNAFTSMIYLARVDRRTRLSVPKRRARNGK